MYDCKPIQQVSEIFTTTFYCVSNLAAIKKSRDLKTAERVAATLMTSSLAVSL